jgi:membrane-associated phospholipid phosphatase
MEVTRRAVDAGRARSLVHPTLFVVAVLAALGAIAVTIYVVGHPFIPEDAVIERDVQSTSWGPLALTFPIFSWIGDAKGAVLEAIIFAAVLVFNRRAWIIALGCAATGVWYVALSHLILRARPTTAQVLQVTEHPGASSFPSGHTMFIVTVTAVLMLCFGQRFLPRWGRVAGWALAAMIVAANALDRIYTGAHWPSDVLAAVLIAVAWISFWVSLRWVSDRALAR